MTARDGLLHCLGSILPRPGSTPARSRPGGYNLMLSEPVICIGSTTPKKPVLLPLNQNEYGY